MRSLVPLLVLVLVLGTASAQEAGPILGTREQAHVSAALHCLNMTEDDLGFAKDHGKPRLVLQRTHDLLTRPLELPALADRVLAAAADEDPEAVWSLAGELLELGAAPHDEVPQPEPPAWEGLDGQLAAALNAFLARAAEAVNCLNTALAAVRGTNAEYLAAASLAGRFSAEDRPQVRSDLAAIGISSQMIDRVIAEDRELDPEPAATNYLNLVESMDLAALVEAAKILERAVRDLSRAVADVQEWPQEPVLQQSWLGPVCIGSTGDDRYESAAVLILDPGGADTYTGDAASANGLQNRYLSVAVDLGGDDRYDGNRVVGPGTALLGVCVLLDCAGNDIYRADYMGQAAGLYGVGWLEDREGNDVYRAHAFAQGAGTVGLGVLRDRQGDDLYDVGFEGQAYAGLRGAGLLLDDAGNDRYMAGGREPDHERNQDRFVSLAQGFATGMRPFGGGGVAALVDRAGNDTYQADVFGQGVGYWYSVGLLLDLAGNDTYGMYQYGQGSGIHLSSGLLFDGGGNDLYTGYILAQGNAHDYAVGMLFDCGGNDTYTADHHSQGRALNNALGILVDSAGDDAYFGRQNDQCQGVGNDGGDREYGSLALLLDLGGHDRYSCGAADGARMLRPDFGIVYDVSPEQAEHEVSEESKGR